MNSTTLDLIPTIFSFCTVRFEKFGSIVFNPYLGDEIEFDSLSSQVLKLCNGTNNILQIKHFMQNQLRIPIMDQDELIESIFSSLKQIGALNLSKTETFVPRIDIIEPLVNSKENFYLSNPKNVILDLTYECNLNCPHCLTNSGPKLSNELETSQILSLIDRFVDAKILTLSLSGGEPFLHKDILKILKYPKLSKMRIDISTNGTCISKEMIQELTNLPIFQIQVSIDGIGEQHDKFRGKKGIFSKACKTIKLLKNSGIFVSIGTTVTRKNLNSLEKIIDLAVELDCNGFKAIPFLPAGRGREHSSLVLSEYENLKFCKILMDKTKQFHQKIKITSETTFPFLFEPFNNFSENQKDGFLGCSAGFELIYIGADGTIYPCPFLKDFPLGNIMENTINEIWNHDPFLNTLRSLKKSNLEEPCRTCCYCPTYCRGGCRAAAYLHSGNLTDVDPSCFKNLIEF